MSHLFLKARSGFKDRLDASALTAALATATTAADVAQAPLTSGAHAIKVGDVFDVSGTCGGGIVIETGAARLDGIATGLTSSIIIVEGDVGARAGRNMRGGRLEIKGDAGDHLATGMKGGVVHVTGSAADGVGALSPGLRFGMTGGTVVIDGNVGTRAGDRMRRGLILVRGMTGAAAGSRMVGGTIVAEGGLGADPGQLMRRGTLIAPHAERLTDTFSDCGSHDLVILKLMWRAWAVQLGHLAPKPIPALVRRFAGDLATIGKGEVLLTAP
jgi:formylmethanofuran dehydrogenase subunit C